MAKEKKNKTARPFTTFNFRVEITLAGEKGSLCEAAFAECDGLEMSMEVKTIKEGGNNVNPIHLGGPVSYSNLTLKRGMTKNFDLWKWFTSVVEQNNYGLRANCTVTMLSSNREKPDAVFYLKRCLPVKLKAPALNAKEGLIAIEEMQIAYERLDMDLK